MSREFHRCVGIQLHLTCIGACMKAELEFNMQVQSTVEPQLSGFGVNSPDNRKSE